MAIEIKIENKIASIVEGSDLVCDNSDYKVHFIFDEEWSTHPVKTARFAFRGTYLDVEFTGDECDMPAIDNANAVAIGVYAGDIRTSTPALMSIKKSILSGAPVHYEPVPDVYRQILALIEAGAVRGPEGPVGPQGPQGEPGELRFKFVSELPDRPEPGTEGCVYCVTKEPEDQDLYDEFYWNSELDAWDKWGGFELKFNINEYLKITEAMATYQTISDAEEAERQLSNRIKGTEDSLVTVNSQLQTIFTGLNGKQNTKTIETFSIPMDRWYALSGNEPYTHYMSARLNTTLLASSIVRLLNDNARLFNKYYFAISSITGGMVTIYSVGKPNEPVNLHFEIWR